MQMGTRLNNSTNSKLGSNFSSSSLQVLVTDSQLGDTLGLHIAYLYSVGKGHLDTCNGYEEGQKSRTPIRRI